MGRAARQMRFAAPLMTRAGLEPATYGLKGRVLIEGLASLSIGKLLGNYGLATADCSVVIDENRAGSESLGFVWGSHPNQPPD
jgi:hypothetical protein